MPGERAETVDLAKRGQGWAGTARAVSDLSPERQTPPCPHFGVCGGCTLQHWQDAPYAAWKSGQLAAALARAGFPGVTLGPLARTPPAGRRRVDFAMLRQGRAVHVGLHAKRSAAVVDLQTCLVLDERLFRLVPALRRIAPGLGGLRRAGSAVVNLLDSGLDILLRTDAELSASDRVALARLADQVGAARISWMLGTGPAEPASQTRPAVVTLAGVEVAPPPGAFLQASPAGEAAIIAAVLAGLPARMAPRAPIVELFAGCGTLTFALARRARVIAYEGAADAHAALRRAGAGKPVQAIQRDLARQPLTAKDLAGAAAIVLDPPFAGAATQMAAIAGSGTPCVIYVTCNPAALTRDARILAGGGYTVSAATPIDQFLWSAQTEGVVVFTRRT